MRIGCLMLLPLLLAAEAWAANATPEQVVAQVWRALSHEPGQGASARELTQLFSQDALVTGSRYKEGQPVLTVTPVAAFISRQAESSVEGFHECEVTRLVRQYDRFATVYSVVESRTVPSAEKPDFVGVNSLQLYRFEDGWRIISLYYQVERPDLPVPLEGGRSGVCLD